MKKGNFETNKQKKKKCFHFVETFPFLFCPEQNCEKMSMILQSNLILRKLHYPRRNGSVKVFLTELLLMYPRSVHSELSCSRHLHLLDHSGSRDRMGFLSEKLPQCL